MITTEQLSTDLASFFSEETLVAEQDGRLSVVTPAEYPDCDGVTVVVDAAPDGRYLVSDMGAADALLEGRFGPQATENKAVPIADRFEIEFAQGSMVGVALAEGELAEVCWRVAQASAALAEGVSFQGLDRLPNYTFDEEVGSALESREVEVQRNAAIEGLSGYVHHPSFFVPLSEAVVEPITGRKAWSRAQGVYTEFGDLRQVNGFQLVAVLDDRLTDASKLADLLSQVGEVASWGRREEWLERVTRRR